MTCTLRLFQYEAILSVSHSAVSPPSHTVRVFQDNTGLQPRNDGSWAVVKGLLDSGQVVHTKNIVGFIVQFC
jgi:hypothetical protein